MGNYRGVDLAKSHLLQVCEAERCEVHPHRLRVFWERFDRVLTNGEASADHTLASQL